MFALTPPSRWISHKHVNHPHLLFCLLLIVLSDGPGAEGRHKPHLRGTPDQDQAARHLLQRLPNPLQLRGTEHVRSPVSSHGKHAGSCHFCTCALQIMPFLLSLRLWNALEDCVPFSRFGTQRALLSGAVVSALTPLEFSEEFKGVEQSGFRIRFFLRCL